MPGAADVFFLIRRFDDFSNLRLAIEWLEEPIDVDLAPVLGEINMLLGREFLISEENHRVLRKSILKLRHHGVAQRLGQVNAIDLRAERC